jgi:hypothetical protein
METRETISLDSRAQQRLYILTHVLAGELTADEAARVLRLPRRQGSRKRSMTAYPYPLPRAVLRALGGCPGTRPEVDSDRAGTCCDWIVVVMGRAVVIGSA